MSDHTRDIKTILNKKIQVKVDAERNANVEIIDDVTYRKR